MNDVPDGTVGRLAVRGPTGCRYLADKRQKNYVARRLEPDRRFFLQDETAISISPPATTT